MSAIVRNVQVFLVSEDGPTAVEYAIMLALIVIVCIGSVQMIGQSANTQFQAANTAARICDCPIFRTFEIWQSITVFPWQETVASDDQYDRKGHWELPDGGLETLSKSWLIEHGGTVLKVVPTWTLTNDKCQDLVQEILLQAWRSLPQFQARYQMTSGLPVISVHCFFCDSLSRASILPWQSRRILMTFGLISSGFPPDLASFINGLISFCIS